MTDSIVASAFHVNSLMAFSILLLIGVIGGRLAHLSRFLPRITGYIIAGFLLGPHGLHILSMAVLAKAEIFTELAVSLILFELGTHVHLPWIFQRKEWAWMSLLECLASFFLIFIVLQFFHVGIFNALLLSAIGVASSPAITLLIAEEYDAQGPLIEKSLFLTAFNNILAFVFFTGIIFLFQFSLKEFNPFSLQIFQPFYALLGSVAVSLLFSLLLVHLGRFLGKHANSQFAVLIAVLLLANGVAKAFHLSTLLTSLLFGIATTNIDKNKDLLEVEFGHSSEIFFIILFVFAGANLHLTALFSIGGIVVALISARFIGKFLSIVAVNAWSSRPETPGNNLALAVTLLPMAGTAIGLLGAVKHVSPETAELLSQIILTSIAVLETLGPILTLLALRKSGSLTATAGDARLPGA